MNESRKSIAFDLMNLRVRAGSGMFASRLTNIGRKTDGVEIPLTGDEGLAELIYKIEREEAIAEGMKLLLSAYRPETVDFVTEFRADYNSKHKLKKLLREVEADPLKDVEGRSFPVVLEKLKPIPYSSYSYSDWWKGKKKTEDVWDFTATWDSKKWKEDEEKRRLVRLRNLQVFSDPRDLKMVVAVLWLDCADYKEFKERFVRMIWTAEAGLPWGRSVWGVRAGGRNGSDAIAAVRQWLSAFQDEGKVEALYGLLPVVLWKEVPEDGALVSTVSQSRLAWWIDKTDEDKTALGDMLRALREAIQNMQKEQAEVEENSKDSGKTWVLMPLELESLQEKVQCQLSRPPKRIKYDPSSLDWGRMGVREASMKPNPTLRRKIRISVATDTGAHIGRLDRVLTDGRVFRETRPVARGTLLVDCSGSMGLSVQDVMMVLENVPGATVGLYAGRPSASEGSYHGITLIVAREGKISADLEKDIKYVLGLGGNVVDGPALEWLATQPKPRIWYSDGGITGVGDSSGDGLREHVEVVCRAAGIVRIENKKLINEGFRIIRKELQLTRYAGE